jgi:hypothetical protein
MDRHALKRLGRHIVSRRVELGYRNRTDFANGLKFTVRTLSDIENGVRKASPGTYAMLENKLGWPPGSIDAFLAAGQEPNQPVAKPRRTTPTSLSHPTTDALMRAYTEELLTELRRRIYTRHHGLPERWDDWDGPNAWGDRDGLDSRGDWPEEG